MFALRFDGSVCREGEGVDSAGQEEKKQNIEDVSRSDILFMLSAID